MRNLKNKKGFTLVEVIVVLVILAILAAILIPSLTGYIAEANKKAVVAEARSVLVAAQTAVSLTFAENATDLAAAVAKGTTELATPATLNRLDIALDGSAPAAAGEGETATVPNGRDAAIKIYNYTEKYSEMNFVENDSSPTAAICIENINGAYKVTELWYYDGSYTAYICTDNTTGDGMVANLMTGDVPVNVWKIGNGNKISSLDTAIGNYNL